MKFRKAMNILFRAKAARLFLLFSAFVALMASCSGNDYLNAIPSTATAIVKVDASKVDASKAASAFSSLLPVGNVEDCGLDFGSDVFVFETVDGNFGLCAKVKSAGKLADTFDALASEGKCGKVRKQGDFTFTDVNDAWAVGFSDKAMVVLGPVSAAALTETQRSVARMLRQDEESSIVGRPMYAKLDSIDGPVAMVAKVQALPEKLVAPFTVGAPSGTDASQVLVAANFELADGVLEMHGETFSFDRQIDAALKKANGVYRKIGGTYLDRVPASCKFGLFTNVDGKQFLPLLQANKPLQALLAGLNTAIDFDNIIRSVNGDMMLLSSGVMSDKLDMSMMAKVEAPSWTGDIGYWKQSCPAGSSITGGNGAWCYNSGDMKFAFGLVGDMFYGTTGSMPNPSVAGGDLRQMPSGILNKVRGRRLVMLLNISAISADGTLPHGILGFMKSALGNVSAVLYVQD